MVNQPCISLYVSGGGIMDSNTCIAKVYHFFGCKKGS